MSARAAKSPHAGHRYPVEVISRVVRLYFRLPPSLRMVEEMLAARGILVSHGTVRRWALGFGQEFADRIRRRPPCPGDKWHLDEVAIRIAGAQHRPWRALDQTGMALDALVQGRRDRRAAERLLRKLLERQCRAPRVMITGKLASHGAARQEAMPGVEHRRRKGLNNRAENPHQPTRRGERQVRRFKSAGQAQRVLSAHDQVNDLFHLRRGHVTASEYRAARARAFEAWADIISPHFSRGIAHQGSGSAESPSKAMVYPEADARRGSDGVWPGSVRVYACYEPSGARIARGRSGPGTTASPMRRVAWH